jgi:hypothetical protein
MEATVVPIVKKKETTVTNPSVIHFNVWKNEKNKKKTPHKIGDKVELFSFSSSSFCSLIIFHTLLVAS